jgi:hypothetical protein
MPGGSETIKSMIVAEDEHNIQPIVARRSLGMESSGCRKQDHDGAGAKNVQQ